MALPRPIPALCLAFLGLGLAAAPASALQDGWQRDPRNLLSGFRNMYQPHVVEVPGAAWPYRMWFFGWAVADCNPGSPGCDAIYTARSLDLMNWEVWAGNGVWDASGNPAAWAPVLTAGNAFFDQWHSGDPSVVLHQGTWFMAYTSTGFDQDGIPGGAAGDTDGWLTGIMGATSADGIHWTKSAAPILIHAADIGRQEFFLPDGSLDPDFTGEFARPSLMWDGDHWRMWFDYWLIHAGGISMGHAENFGDPMNPADWTVTHNLAVPLIQNWPNPDVVRFGGVYYSFADPVGYPCAGQSPWTCRQPKGAVSRDGLTWFPWEGFVAPDPDAPAIQVPELFVERGSGRPELHLFYATQIGGQPYDFRYNRIRAMKRPIRRGDLFLLASPRDPVAGGTVAFTTRWAPAGTPAALFLVSEAPGAALRRRVAAGLFGAGETWTATLRIPPRAAGHTLRFRTYAVPPAAPARSSIETVTVR